MKWNLTDEQAEKLNKALRGEKVDLTEEEVPILNEVLSSMGPKPETKSVKVYRPNVEPTPPDLLDYGAEYVKAIGEKGKGLVQGISELPGQIASGAKKVYQDPSKNLPELGKAIALEGYPFAETLQTSLAGVAAPYLSLASMINPAEYKTPDEKKAELLAWLKSKKEGLDPDIKALAQIPAMATGALTKPVTLGTSAVISGLEGLSEGLTRGESVPEALASGTLAAAPTGVIAAAKSVIPAVTSSALKSIPKVLMRRPEEAVEEYVKRAPDITGASESKTIEKITQFGDLQRKAVEDAKLNLRLAEKDVELAQNKFDLAQMSQSADKLKEVEAAKLSLYETQNKLAEAKQNLKDLESDKKTSLTQLRSEVKNVPEEASQAVKEAIVSQKAKLGGLAAEQAKYLDEIGETIDIRGLKEQLLEDLNKKKLNLEKVKVDKEGNETIVSRPWGNKETIALLKDMQDLPEEMSASELLVLRQELRDLGFGREQAIAGTKSAYSTINDLIDQKAEEVFGSDIGKTTRADLKKEIDLRNDIKKLINQDFPSKTLSKVGEKNDIEIMKVLNRLQESTKLPVITSELSNYINIKNQIREKAGQGFSKESREIKELEQIAQRQSETLKSLLKKEGKAEYPEDIFRPTTEARENLSSAIDNLNKYGYTDREAQTLIRRGEFKPREDYAATKEIKDLASAMNEPNLPQEIKDIGYQRALQGSTTAGSRLVNLGRSAGAAIGGSPGAFIGGLGGAMLDVAKFKTATVPLDIIRLGKYVANTKFAGLLNSSLERAGKSGVIATHFILQSKYPEYRAMVEKAKEDKDEIVNPTGENP